MTVYHLLDRTVIEVTGEDADSFLQNVITNDMRRLTPESPVIYACLLTPQGQILHDFFVWRAESEEEGGRYRIDIDRERAGDFMRRLSFMKLRSKVVLAQHEEYCVMASTDHRPGFVADPRSPLIGFRAIGQTSNRQQTSDTHLAYHDLAVSLGLPVAQSIDYERDVFADCNLDLLNAAAWDKGCFIGQEVAARMYHRKLNRKRLMRVESGSVIENSAPVLCNGQPVGDIRAVTSDGKKALALVKLSLLPEGERTFSTPSSPVLTLQNPPYANFL